MSQRIPAESVQVGDVLDMIGGPQMVTSLTDWRPYPVPLFGETVMYRQADTKPGIGISLFKGGTVAIVARAGGVA